MAKTAYVGIGSNLGDRENNCRKAIHLIHALPGSRLTAKSDFYRTEPVGVEGQDWYVNAVISLETDLSPQDLLTRLLGIEAEMGRQRKKKWDSRVIDLDILIYGEHVIREPNLTVPHPFMHLRRFVLVPMAQLAPDLMHPVLGMTMKALLAQADKEGQAVLPMEEI